MKTPIYRPDFFPWGGPPRERLHTTTTLTYRGILIHSALSVPDEVIAFRKKWGDRLPVVIVPTKYYSTPTEVFRQYGFSVAIWANHVLRAAVTGMQRVVGTIVKSESLMGVEDSVASVAEIFRLQGEKELEEAERRYLPEREAGVRSVVIVTGHLAHFYEKLAAKRCGLVETVHNPRYMELGSFYSLQVALEHVAGAGPLFLLESDLVYEPRALYEVLADPHEDVVLLSGPTGSRDEVWVETDGSWR